MSRCTRPTIGRIAAVLILMQACTSGSVTDSQQSPGQLAEIDDRPVWSGTLDLETVTDWELPESASPLLNVTIVANNVGSDTLRGSTDSCIWWFRLYDNASRSGQPVWRSEGSERACFQLQHNWQVAPGQATQFPFQRGGRALDMLGDQEPGTFYLGAVFASNDPEFRTREFAAGSIELPPE